MNASSQPKDIAVPGLTIHEAVTLYQPPAASCTPIAGAPAAILGLQQLLSEAQNFYPVLGTFTDVRPMTQLNVALSLRPTLTTVWLGANDVLHFAFSGGAFTGIDNASQTQADMTQIITALKRAGSDVVVANVPNVLQSPFYFSVATPPSAQACQLQNFAICDLEALGVPAANAAAIVSGIATQYGLGSSGYLTLQGFLAEVSASPQFSADLNALAGGNGLGSMYVTPAFATAIQAENDAVNTGISAAATVTDVPMVDVKTMMSDVATGNVNDPVAAEALTISPGKCCSLAFLGGILSFDGLHPSNTGYAFIADGFINAINAKYGTTIAPIDPAAVYNGTGAIPFADPYAQH
jgi:lysophospholipase L1-like esterase